jgi:hypothetical protein
MKHDATKFEGFGSKKHVSDRGFLKGDQFGIFSPILNFPIEKKSFSLVGFLHVSQT